MPLIKAKVKRNIAFVDLFSVSCLKKIENVILLQKVASTYGLPSGFISKLVDLLGSKKLSISTKIAMIDCIVPKDSIPKDFLLKMSSYLTDFKFDLNLKIEILKRIIVIRPFVNSSSMEQFLCLYEIFLRLLNYEILRPHVVYLLYSFSTKGVVTSNRINYIFKLQDKSHCQPWLSFILSLYSKLQPKLVSEILPDFKPNFDNALHFYPNLIEDINSLRIPASTLEESYIETESFHSFHFGIEKCEHEIVEDSDDNVTIYSQSEKQIVLSKNASSYNSFENIYKKFLTFKDSSVQKIMSSEFRRLILTSDMSVHAQISIFDYIWTSLYCSLDFDTSLPEILDVLREIQEPEIPVTDLMKNVIEFWDGYSNFYAFLEIISYQTICCFDKIAFILDILLEIMKTAPVIQKCHLIHTFSKLYQKWALTEFSHCSHVPCEGNCSSCSEDILSEKQVHHLSINELYKLGSYIDTICDEFLSNEHFDPCILNQILLHYERMSYSHIRNIDLILHLPTPTVYTSALFSLSALTLENMCRLMLGFYKDVYSQAKQNHPEIDLAKRFYNSYFSDLCHVLWGIRHKSTDNAYLSKTQAFKTLKKFCPNFSDSFRFYQHPGLLLKIMTFFKRNKFSHTLLSIQNVSEVCERYLAYFSKDDSFEYFLCIMRHLYETYHVKHKYVKK